MSRDKSNQLARYKYPMRKPASGWTCCHSTKQSDLVQKFLNCKFVTMIASIKLVLFIEKSYASKKKKETPIKGDGKIKMKARDLDQINESKF